MEGKSLPADSFGLVGTLLDRKYRVERVAAAGGFGVVYAGHHLGLDRTVAIKVMRPLLDVDPDAWADGVTAFLHEAKTIAKIPHPAVVGVLDAGVMTLDRFPGGVPWIVLEWIEGETLEAHLETRRGQGRSPEDALALLRPVFEAVASAHAVGVLHRDLKPSNIMLQSSSSAPPRVRVLDFGIAKLARDEPATTGGNTTTRSQSRAFSAACAAPEQISGTRTGPWTDIYALALLLTEVLTDASPYPLGDPTARFAVVFDARRPTPQKLGVDVGAWEPILARALAVHPSERQASVQELLADLDASLPEALSVRSRTSAAPSHVDDAAGASLAAPASTGDAPVARGPRRGITRATWRAASLGAASLAIVAAGALTWRSRHPVAGADVQARTTPAAPLCASSRACSADGTPSVCRKSDHRCVPLASVDCTVLADDAAKASDDTVWIGAMFPLVGDDAADFGKTHARAVDLAQQDFTQTMSALAASIGGDVARPIGLVSCDDATDPRRAAAHLVDDVGAPAIIGFHTGVEQIELATSSLFAKDVLSIAAVSVNPLVTRAPQPPGQPRLVWRTTYDTTTTAPAAAALIDLLAATTARGGTRGKLADARARVRIASVHRTGALDGAYADALVNAVRARQPRPGSAYDLRDVPYNPDATDVPVAYAATAAELVAFEPDVVVFSGGQQEVQRFLVPLEAAPSSRARPPIYVSAATLGSDFVGFVGANAALRRRVLGLSTVSNSPANARFLNRYHEVFPDDHVTRTFAPDTAYDAFYLLAYAVYAIPAGTPVTGPNLSLAFDRLHGPGRAVQVGLVDIFDGYRELAAGRAIDLVGAAGDLDLDRATGEGRFDQSVLCLEADAQGRATQGIESGLVYSASARRLVGKMRCP